MRVAIVGCGYVADQYMLTLPLHRGLELVAVTDRDTTRVERFGAHYRVPAFRSLSDLLAGTDVELVLNLTNPRSHYQVTRDCLEAGRHVYSEKPLALQAGDSRELVALAAARGLVLSGAPSRVLAEPAQTMWKAIREGAIGRPLLAYAEMDDGMHHRMDYRDWVGASGAPWPYQDEAEMGCTVEHAGYALTWLVAFFGPARSVTASTAVLLPDKGAGVASADHMGPDFSVSCIRFASGLVARLTCSTIAPADHSIRVFGDEGTIATEDCWKPQSAVSLERRSGPRGWVSPPIRTTVPLLRDPGAITTPQPMKKVDFCLGPLEAMRAITERRPCRLSAGFCAHVAEIVLAIHDAREGAGSVPITSSFEPMAPMPWAT